MKQLIFFVVVSSSFSFSSALQADVELTEDDKILSVTGLSILGARYDAMMHYGPSTFLEYKALPDIMPITFTSRDDATVAANAIVAEILADTSIADLKGTNDMFIPWIDAGDSTNTKEIAHHDNVTYASMPFHGLQNAIRVGLGRDDDAWVSFQPAVVPGDVDGDGKVGQSDLSLVLANWGEGFDEPGLLAAPTLASSHTVPEPASSFAMLLPIWLWIAANRTRRKPVLHEV